MHRRALAVVGLIMCWPLSAYSADDEDAITRLMVEAYVEGVYINRDESAVLRGFHPDFVLHVKREDRITTETLTQWLERLSLDGTKNSQSVDYKVVSIDVTGDSAVATLLIYLDSRLIYTDYFGFYRFDEGWRFMNKIFYGHE